MVPVSESKELKLLLIVFIMFPIVRAWFEYAFKALLIFVVETPIEVLRPVSWVVWIVRAEIAF